MTIPLRYYTLLLLVGLLTQKVYAAYSPLCPISNIPIQKNSHTILSTEQITGAHCAYYTDYWSTLLHWQTTPTAGNLCKGYFYEPDFIHTIPNPPSLNTSPLNITTSGISVYSLNNKSILQGNVILTQPGRQILADKVILIPNQQTKQIQQIQLEGNVYLQEAGKLIAGNSSLINWEKQTFVIYQSAYHLGNLPLQGASDIWGTADAMHRESDTFSWLDQGTYTTCPPLNPFWYLQSKKVSLNKKTGRGTAKHVWIYVKHVPVLYLPYLSFPLDKKRYSGFLYPTFGYDKESGAFIGIPYYFNLAPNYDDTLTITPMTERGVLFNNLFNYLTPKHTGWLKFGFLPADSAFKTFKATASQMYNSQQYQPFIQDLNHSSDNRMYASFHNTTIFNQHWSSAIDLNYVSDDYYFQDFSLDLNTLTNDQLLNQAIVTYKNEYWNF